MSAFIGREIFILLKLKIILNNFRYRFKKFKIDKCHAK